MRSASVKEAHKIPGNQKGKLSDRSKKISALGGGANGYPERYGFVACQSWHRGNPGVRELLAF